MTAKHLELEESFAIWIWPSRLEKAEDSFVQSNEFSQAWYACGDGLFSTLSNYH